ANIPPNLPAEVMQQLVQQILQQSAVVGVPGTPFQTKHAVMESARLASCYTQDGIIFASRQPDLSFKVAHVVERQGWETAYPRPRATRPVAATPPPLPPPEAATPPPGDPA